MKTKRLTRNMETAKRVRNRSRQLWASSPFLRAYRLELFTNLKLNGDTFLRVARNSEST